MEETRFLRDDEWEQAIALANRVFRDEEQSSMDQAFPYSFSSALSQSIGAFQQGRLVSFMGLVPAVMQVGPAQLDVFMLGQVCTDESARGKGYASQVMDAVLRHIAGSGASLMLVSGVRSLYERSGCLPFGRMHKFLLNRDWAQGHSNHETSRLFIRERNERDWFGIKRLADARAVRFQYSIWDLAGLIEAEARASCMKHELRVLVAEREGVLAGFLIYTVPAMGKRVVRRPEAIEWAGEAAVVTALAAYAIRAHSFEELFVSVPDYDKPMLEQLSGVSRETGSYPGTMRVVDPQTLLRQLEPYWRDKGGLLPAGYHSYRLEDHSVVLHAGEQEVKLTAQQFINRLFAPQAAEQASADRGKWPAATELPVPLPSPHGLLYV